jgi:hypothetical protein
MAQVRTRQLTGNNSIPVAGFYGSNQASKFLQDAIAGTDSVDIIVIGDSNAGYPSNNGYTVGWHRAMQFGFGVPCYATSMFSGGPSLPTGLTTGNNRSDGMWGIGVQQAWNAQGEAGGSNTGTTFKQMIQSSDSNIVGLRSWLGFSYTNYTANDTTNASLFPLGWMSNPAVVETGARFTGNFNNYIQLSNQPIAGVNSFGSEMVFGTAGLGGNALQYRIVYGTFPTAGSFKPYSFYLGTTGAVLRDSATTSTGGGYGYATKAFDVSSFTLGTDSPATQPTRICFTWDGANSATNADQANGPFACLWQSVIRPNFKGYSVSCLNYLGGLTTTQLAQKVEDCDKMLDAYLKEIRERQIGATAGTAGTGRAVVFCNTGVNGPDTSTTWPAGTQRIVDRIVARWVSTGGNADNLAFVFTVTHPKTLGTWATNRAAVSTAANSWAATAGKNVCVVDIQQVVSGLKLQKHLMYQDTTTDAGQSHLAIVAVPPAAGTMATDAYASITQSIVSTLLAAK